MTRPLVMIESPFAGDTERNLRYLAACIQHSLELGEAPFASHGFYTQWLDDSLDHHRALGMECGRAWALRADLIVFYLDLGWSPGMEKTANFLSEKHWPMLTRTIGWRDGSDN